MVNFKIIFDRPDHKYFPGDRINLEFRVQVHSNTTYSSIYTRLQGFSHVEWTESRQVQRNGKSHTEYTTYSSNESYFRNYQTLAGTERGPDMNLAPGSHIYRASFQLPRTLPQNHEADNGHIRYEAKIHMDVPWGFDNKESTSFFVKPLLDLNEFSDLREPVRMEAHKTFGCCCWESEPLHIFNVLPRRGFVPGDRVPFTLEMKNDSDVTIYGATVKLIEKIVYHAYSPSTKTRDRRRTLWEHHFDDRAGQLVMAMQNKIFSTELHFDPSWDLHFFNGCGIITVEYYLKSEARTSGCHTNLDNHTSITMGTIPLQMYAPQFTPLAPMFPNVVMPSAPAPTDYPSAPPGEPITEQPLPSYNDAVSKPAMVPPPGGAGWAASDSMETPPPTFTDLNLTEKKEKQ